MGKIAKLFAMLRNYGAGTTFRVVKSKLTSGPRAQKHKLVSMIKKSMEPGKLLNEGNEKFDFEPLFSILIPLYNTDISMLKCVIESVINQSRTNWELCLADGSDTEHSYVEKICREYAAANPRIHYKKLEENLGISGNTNVCASMATGTYMVLADHDDFIHPCAIYELTKAVNISLADFIYTDEVTFEGSIDNILSYNLKPDYSKDTLRANNYICHLTAFTAELFYKAGGFRRNYDGSQDHDLFLRMTEIAGNIVHIPQILYFWRAHKGSVVEDISVKQYAINAGINAVEDYLGSVGIKAHVESSHIYPTIYRIHYPVPKDTLISVIIPNRNHLADLKRCINSLTGSTYKKIEIIIVENNSDTEEVFRYYDELSEKVKIVTRNIPFNYSALNNAGAEAATGEYLLFLNNDTEAIEESWMEEMLMYAARDDVGAVGAKLLYANNTIQHCFLITGAGEDKVAVHAGLGLPKDDYGYLDRIGFPQNVSAVTGACMLVNRNKFFEAGGFDEELPVAYNDVDLCLKLRKLGYVNVYTPYALLYHYESMSRGSDLTKENQTRLQKDGEYMRNKWGDFLKDPYYNSNFSTERQYVLK